MPGACFLGGESCFPPHGIPILQMLSVVVELPLPSTLNWHLCNFPHMLSYQQQVHSSVPECLLTELYSTRTPVAFWLTLSRNETTCTSQLYVSAFHKYIVFTTWMNGQSKIDTSMIRILSHWKLHDQPWFPTLWSDPGHPYLGKWVLYYRKTIDKSKIY